MSFVPHSHVPYGTDGSGYYTDNTIGCFNVIREATPLTLLALKKISLAKKNVYTICDYGTADGGTSMYLIRECIAQLKSENANVEVHVWYEDQPVNDFKSLFLRIQGLLPGPPSFMKEFSGVYIAAVGTGFYEQCVPTDSVDLGFSATAMHWLTHRPCSLKKVLHHSMSEDDTEVRLFREQAAKDWVTLLTHRAAELTPGGQLVIVSFCIDEKGQYLGNTEACGQSMFATMTKLWRQLVTDGIITQEEFENTTFNNYYRTVDECSAPFKDENSPVCKAGLRLVSIETKVVPCPYRFKWLQSGKDGDLEAARKHAKWFIPTTRTWSNYTFYSGLSESRSEEERNAIVDRFFQNYEAEVAAAPEQHGMDYVHAYMRFEKVQ